MYFYRLCVSSGPCSVQLAYVVIPRKVDTSFVVEFCRKFDPIMLVVYQEFISVKIIFGI